MKSIPIALKNHKSLSSTTLADLVQIGPLEDGSYRGLTDLDAPVEYSGCLHPITLAPLPAPVVFHARTGFQSSAFTATADTGVDNSEVTTLPPMPLFTLEGITQAQVDSGALDKVPVLRYRVNYRDLSMGHEIVFSGTVGEIRYKSQGATILEMRSLSNQGKQTLCELDSILCRVRKFGSQPGEERFPCGYDISSEWVESAVISVDEPDRRFASSLTQVDGYFVPGVVRWISGANSGVEVEIEEFSGGEVTLLFPTPNPISDDDQFEVRRDCSRAWEGHNSCQTFWGVDRNKHYRGEPHMPVGDGARLLTPGASSGSFGGISGTGE